MWYLDKCMDYGRLVGWQDVSCTYPYGVVSGDERPRCVVLGWAWLEPGPATTSPLVKVPRENFC